MMPRDRFSLLLEHTCLLGCSLGAAATLYFLVGWSGHLGNLVLNGATAALTVIAALVFLYLFVGTWDGSRLGVLVWLLILAVLVVEVVLALVPPTARDELTHHLALARVYVAAGRIFEVPFAPYSYYPMLLDMLYTPWVKWGWDSVPKLIHGLFGFLTALLIYAYLSRRLSPIYGLVGFFCFITTPALLRLSNWAYVDLGLTFYSTASLLCLLEWREAGQKRRLALAGLLAGFTFATKPNGLLVLFLLFFLVLYLHGKTAARPSILTGQLCLFLTLAAVPVAPWLVRNFIWTGNPLFPFFLTFSGGSGEGGGEAALGIFAKRQLLFGESWWQLAGLPVRVFFSGEDDNPQYFDGTLNPMLILFLPWAFKGKWLEDKRLLLAFALFYFLYALFLTDLRIRYILPIVPPLVLLLLCGIHNVYLRIRRPWVLFLVVTLLLGMNGVYLWNYFQRVSPLGYLAGSESREAYLTRMLADYPAFQYINQNLPSSARVYLLFVGRRAYYCERDYFHDPGDNAWILIEMIKSAKNEADMVSKLQGMALSHLLVREELLDRFLSTNLSSPQRRIWDGFAALHLRRLFAARGYSVYRIDG